MGVYKWKVGTRIKADPNLAAEVLNKLAEQNRLDAENVVEVSKPEGAVLHDDFEWDDAVAAIKFRNHQARNIINALVVVEEETPEEPPMRVFFKIEENTNNYTPLKTIMQSADSTEALLRKALSELQAYKMKFDSIVKKCNAEKEYRAFEEKLKQESA